MTYDEILKRFTERVREAERVYYSRFSEKSLERSKVSRAACERRTTEVLSDAIRKYSKVARKRTIVEAFNL